MFDPRVESRVEESYFLPRHLVYGLNRARLVKIARAAGESQIGLGRLTAVRLRNDVLDFEREVENDLGSAAVFAGVAGAG
jgi:hypothetical protein